jgi:2-iminobutanoate/2-iminopropanoate deaminase
MPVKRRDFIKTGGATALGMSAVAAASAQNTNPTDASAVKKAASTTGAAQAVRPKTVRKKRRVVTDRAPRPVGPYSQAIVANNTVYVAGQIATSPKTGKIDAKTFEEQATQVFENIKAIVEGAGSSLENVVSVRFYLADLNDFSKMNAIYREYFTGDFPARTTVGAQLLPDVLIEIDCVAVV